jgi:inward rectifier potassium channel
MAKKTTLLENEKNRQDLGFGSKVTDKSTRLITQSGQFNVRRSGQSFNAWLNIYHRLITMSWWKLVGIIFFFYFIMNVLFATIYLWIGIENINGANLDTEHSKFWDAFFFSAQSLTTVGYGHLSPKGFSASWVASIEALLGLMIFAIITGLLYGRFSRPNPKIKFSSMSVIAPYLDINGWMFRMVNERSNQLINVSVSVILSRIEERNGHPSRRYYGLDLERSKVSFFPMNWTIVHPITDESPLNGETLESMRANDTEFLISVEGIDDTFSDTVYARQSYFYNEIAYGAKFKSMLEPHPIDEVYILDLDKIDDIEKVNLN